MAARNTNRLIGFKCCNHIKIDNLACQKSALESRHMVRQL